MFRGFSVFTSPEASEAFRGRIGGSDRWELLGITYRGLMGMVEVRLEHPTDSSTHWIRNTTSIFSVVSTRRRRPIAETK